MTGQIPRTRRRFRCNGCAAEAIVHDTPAVEADGVLVLECGECGYKMVERGGS